MLCCIVVVVLLGVGARFMPWTEARDDGGFAPTASRSGPGDAGERPVFRDPFDVIVGRHTEPSAPPRLRSAVPTMLQAAALGCALYLPFSVALMALGIAEGSAARWSWLTQSLLLAAATVAAIGLSAAIGRRTSRLRGPLATGISATTIGATLLLFLQLDLHLVGLFRLTSTIATIALPAILATACLAGIVIALAARVAAPTRPERLA